MACEAMTDCRKAAQQILGVDVCSKAHQSDSFITVPVANSVVKRGAAVLIRGIDIDSARIGSFYGFHKGASSSLVMVNFPQRHGQCALARNSIGGCRTSSIALAAMCA